MPALKSTFICPYCFEEQKLKQIAFSCMNKRCENFMTSEGYFPAAAKNKFNFPLSEVCPACGQKSFKVVCPSCHNPLPESTLSGRDMIISIVGGTGTGKSNFVGVIIKELIERIAPKFGGAMVGFDDTMKRYREGFETVLYGNNPQTMPRTQALANAADGSYKPLIFTLSLKNKTFFKETIDCFTFVFFDTAGEDLNDEASMRTVNNYICKSAGIIFLLDPLTIPAVREQLDDTTINGASFVGNAAAFGSDDIMSRVSQMIREDRGMSASTSIDIPVAAVFSKFDAVYPLVPEGSTVKSPSPHCDMKNFALTDAQNVDMEVRSLLKEWGDESFLMQVEVNYTTHAFFAASAFGLNNNPNAATRLINRPKPHRIEDPILWILMKNGVIPTSKK